MTSYRKMRQRGDKMPEKESKAIIPKKQGLTTGRLSVYAGLIAPVLLVSLVAVLSKLESGYSNKTQMMSVLGGVPGIRGLIFNLGLSITGILIVVFAFGLHKSDLSNVWIV